jgi:hypothetical protein
VKLINHPEHRRDWKVKLINHPEYRRHWKVKLINHRIQMALECEVNITPRIREVSFKTECSYNLKDSTLTLSTNLQTQR